LNRSWPNSPSACSRPAATPASAVQAVFFAEAIDLSKPQRLAFRDPNRRPWARLVARGLIQFLLVGMLPAEWQVRAALWPAFAFLAVQHVERSLMRLDSRERGIDAQQLEPHVSEALEAPVGGQ
jgi:hypothetical protein